MKWHLLSIYQKNIQKQTRTQRHVDPGGV